jgi:hypothetical protein
MKGKPRVIAFYLPQFHPTPNNDIWWGKGFTEWTNVCKARPLFKGHYQPRVPSDLGFYDLRLEETRIAQAEMAREYGVEGFCYYHYWFGNGKVELERPFAEVLESGKPDFPFMLCWANETWHAKFWNKDGSALSKEILVEQQYGGIDDYTRHFYHLLPAFRDKRYLSIDNKPVFMIYRSLAFEDIDFFIALWRKLAGENGLGDLFFIGQTENGHDREEILHHGFDAVNVVNLWRVKKHMTVPERIYSRFCREILGMPFVFSYKKAKKYFITDIEQEENVIPTIIPNYDHSPRSGNRGMCLTGCSPELFGEHIHDAIDVIRNKPNEKKLIFIKSWNEWGEGNYMEPDLKFGKKYLEVLRDKINEL